MLQLHLRLDSLPCLCSILASSSAAAASRAGEYTQRLVFKSDSSQMKL